MRLVYLGEKERIQQLMSRKILMILETQRTHAIYPNTVMVSTLSARRQTTIFLMERSVLMTRT